MNPVLAESFASTDIAPDDALVLRCLDGDSAAFETLVCRYRRVVMRLTRRITGNLEDAEDVAQQAFMKVLINLSRFRFRSSFSTWLVSIAMNKHVCGQESVAACVKFIWPARSETIVLQQEGQQKDQGSGMPNPTKSRLVIRPFSRIK